MDARRGTLAERLDAKIDRADPDGCWPFTGALNNRGYGVIRDGAGRMMLAHRASLALTGVDVAGKVVRHSCDNPRCCRPSHLIAGTQSDNLRDMVAKRRGLVGTLNGAAKLTETDVIEIRASVERRESRERIASRFGVGVTTVRNIATGQRWTHVEAA